jgi:hypothetical protein
MGAKIVRRERGEVAFPQDLKPLNEADYSIIMTRAGAGGPPPDYVRINGQLDVADENAELHSAHIQKTGAARYTKDYYGIFTAAVLGRLYEKSGMEGLCDNNRRLEGIPIQDSDR